MDGYWKSEGAVPSLNCRVIQAFEGPKALQWGGMIQIGHFIFKLHGSNIKKKMVQWLLHGYT